jgi:hypothetical protein
MLHWLQIWHWTGVVLVMFGNPLMVPRLYISMMESMQTWPRRI